MVIDMRMWEKLSVTDSVLLWARENKHRRLWRRYDAMFSSFLDAFCIVLHRFATF